MTVNKKMYYYIHCVYIYIFTCTTISYLNQILLARDPKQST